MDNQIKRLQQILLALAISGVFSLSIIDAHLQEQADYKVARHLYFARILLSGEYSSTVNIDGGVLTSEYMSGGPYETALEELRKKVSPPAANERVRDIRYTFLGLISGPSGIRYAYRAAEEVKIENKKVDLLSGDDEGSTKNNSRAILDEGHLRVAAKECPPLDIETGTDLRESWTLRCFKVWREALSGEDELLWIADGKQFWTGFEVVKEDGLFLVNGNRFHSLAEVESTISMIVDRYGISAKDAASNFLSFRNKVMTRTFKVPIVNIDANLTNYYRFVSAICLVFAGLLLHTCLALFDRSRESVASEPWLVMSGKVDLSVTGVLRGMAMTLAAIFYFAALILPFWALGRMEYELDLYATIAAVDVRIITATAAGIAFVAAAYCVLAAWNQGNLTMRTA